jgi:hypothetical protein|tara:strand:- start:87 stop:341 length:255 start_codon:yes stop_codon:yes gene_type:complete
MKLKPANWGVLEGKVSSTQESLDNYNNTVVICYSCNKSVHLKNTHVDVEGEPYRAYYCRPCTDNIMNKEAEIFALEQQQSNDGE